MNRKIIFTATFFILVSLVSGVQSSVAQDSLINEINLREYWRVFEKDTRSFEEYSSKGKVKTVKWHIQFKEGVDGWLEIQAPEETYLLINSKYTGQINRRLTIDIDSLIKIESTNAFEFTVFSNSGLSSSNLSTKMYEGLVSLEEGVPTNRKGSMDFMNFYVLAVLIILMFIGILYRKFPRDTLDYFAFQRSLSFKNREETLISTRPFSRTNVLFIILDSLVIGFLIVSMVTLTKGYVYFPTVSTEMSFVELLLSWPLTSLIIFASLTLKYLLMNIFIGLFRLGDFRYIQHYNSLRFSLGAFLLIFLLVTVTYLAFRTEGLEAYFIFIKILITLLVMRILVLFFKLRDYTSYRNFHLFSYLCATEIIPFIILYKLVLG